MPLTVERVLLKNSSVLFLRAFSHSRLLWHATQSQEQSCHDFHMPRNHTGVWGQASSIRLTTSITSTPAHDLQDQYQRKASHFIETEDKSLFELLFKCSVKWFISLWCLCKQHLGFATWQLMPQCGTKKSAHDTHVKEYHLYFTPSTCLFYHFPLLAFFFLTTKAM